jgi:hypothetical protein
MATLSQEHCTAFVGSRRIASGDLEQVVREAQEIVLSGEPSSVLIFDDVTGERIEVNFHGTIEETLRRLSNASRQTTPDTVPSAPENEAPRGPGRPRLGVVAREVTLLPRHWDWLNDQPGGASVALRKLVEEARRRYEGRDHARRAQEAAYRFMSAMAGNFADFEEAMRAFFANDKKRFEDLIESWPADVRDHARTMAAVAFQAKSEQ